MTWTVHHGDCCVILPTLGKEWADAVVTDPPYHYSSIVERFGNTSQADDTDTSERARDGADGYARLSRPFMGHGWDAGEIAFQKATWRHAWEALKPGGYLLSFGSTIGYHRMAVAIEDAGFEIRDCIQWLYGSGFPKSLNIAKAITAKQTRGGSSPKALRQARMGDDYQPTGQENYRAGRAFGSIESDDRPTALTPAAKQWDGWGTALKPACELICVARKPLGEKTVAENVLKYGTGGINLDGCRIGTDDTRGKASATALGLMNDDGWTAKPVIAGSECGRFPANVIHDGSDEVLALFPQTTSGKPAGVKKATNKIYGKYGTGIPVTGIGDSGSAALFFYCAKAGKKERPWHCPICGAGGFGDEAPKKCCGKEPLFHATVKPLSLMRYLTRLVCQPGGTILDPFAGSGATLEAASLEGFNVVGCELTAEHMPLIELRRQRAAAHEPKPESDQMVML